VVIRKFKRNDMHSGCQMNSRESDADTEVGAKLRTRAKIIWLGGDMRVKKFRLPICMATTFVYGQS
jgi:hypothetical protein